MTTIRRCVFALSFAMVLATLASAAPYVIQGPFVAPIPGWPIPAPGNVPGKEYADAFNNGQSLFWDGAGGTQNAQLYPCAPDCQIDALANEGDALFNAVINNRAALIFSVTGNNNIFYEDLGGGSGVWAPPALINSDGVREVEALEVWGPELVVDANRYSVLGDTGGCAAFDIGGACLITSDQVANAIAPLPLAGLMPLAIVEAPDIDALMWFGKTILFSIRPMGAFDGGEVWVWDTTDAAPGAARFLNHGGHIWDTAFSVKDAFGVADENINALEAVATIPEPSTLLLLGAGLLALGLLRRRV